MHNHWARYLTKKTLVGMDPGIMTSVSWKLIPLDTNTCRKDILSSLRTTTSIGWKVPLMRQFESHFILNHFPSSGGPTVCTSIYRRSTCYKRPDVSAFKGRTSISKTRTSCAGKEFISFKYQSCVHTIDWEEVVSVHCIIDLYLNTVSCVSR